MRSTMMDWPLVLDHLLERAAALFPKKQIVSRRGDRSLVRYGYADLARRARALAGGLQRAGLKEGDRVATLMWNHDFHMEAYFGVPAAGGVYHTLNPRLAPDELAYIVNDAADRFLLVDDVLLPVLARFAGEVSLERVFVASVGGPGAPERPATYEDIERLFDEGDRGFTPLPRDEGRAAGLCYTSGTTGRSKGVSYSHRALVLHALQEAMVDTLAVREADVVLPVVPMFHANAWGFPFTAALTGAKLVLPGPHVDPDGLLDLIEGERVSIAAGVPTVALGLLQVIETKPRAFPKDMRLVIGGAAAPEAVIRAYHSLGVHVLHAWGMTEMSPVGTVCAVKSELLELPPDELYALRAKQGIAVPLVEVRARGAGGIVAWDGATPGELEVRGPWVAARYFGAERGEDRWTDDGWFRTGDIVTIDAEGYVQIVDRAKDLIKSGGEWISSVALENALMGHDAVRESAVIAIPHPKWGERPLAVVVLRSGKAATEEDLRAHLAKTFPSWALPDGYVWRDEIPRTAAGKFLKSKLREELHGWTPEGT